MYVEYIIETTVMYTWHCALIVACVLHSANIIRGWIKEKNNDKN